MNMLNGNALQTNNSSKIVISVKDHEIGDIVWAKLGKFPFWPSIVCLDPKSKIFIKKNKKVTLIHIRFCNDNGNRCWININAVKHFNGKQEFLSKYPGVLSSLKKNKKMMDTWNVAVQEASHLSTIANRGRMIQYFKNNSLEVLLIPATSNTQSISSTPISTGVESNEDDKKEIQIPLKRKQPTLNVETNSNKKSCNQIEMEPDRNVMPKQDA